MKWNKAGFVFVILISCLYFSPASQANECEVTSSDYETAISLMATSCFDLDENTTALGLEVKDLLDSMAGDDRSRALLALKA